MADGPTQKAPQDRLTQRTLWSKDAKRELIPLPTPWSSFHYEYDSPVIWIPPAPAARTFDFSFANRGAADQMFCILLTEFHFAPDQPTALISPTPSRAGRIFLVNWFIELPLSVDSSGWWARMFTTSRDVIPSIHVYADTPDSDTNPSVYPDFYIAPGDCLSFEIPGGYVPPGFGPAQHP
jgi:hypothetical protein